MVFLDDTAWEDTLSTDWDSVVETYDRVCQRNASVHVQRMSADQVRRYCELHNCPGFTKEDVLAHKIQQSAYSRRLLNGRLDPLESPLLARLLTGRPALDHEPPRSFGYPWYLLFDAKGPFDCEVSVHGQGARASDGASVWILHLNEGPWECHGGSTAALHLIDLDRQWWGSMQPERASLWPTVWDHLTHQDVSFQLRFGTWPTPFMLWLENTMARESQIPLAPVTSNNLFTMLTGEQSFADLGFKWLIDR